MCTVSFLPRRQGGFILTSNRDEAPDRAVWQIHQSESYGQRLYFPRDPGAGGTWFCISNSGRIACLLNGAHHAFIPKSVYRKSRGKVVLELFGFRDVSEFVAAYDFKDIAPFTLIIIDQLSLHCCIWDGEEATSRILDFSQPWFWSSATLYSPEIRKWRSDLFDEWLQANNSISQSTIMAFHQFGSDDLYNGFVMNRDEKVKTLSITSVSGQADRLSLIHQDLKMKTSETLDIKVSQPTSLVAKD